MIFSANCIIKERNFIKQIVVGGNQVTCNERLKRGLFFYSPPNIVQISTFNEIYSFNGN